jgi:hypothetical protein
MPLVDQDEKNIILSMGMSSEVFSLVGVSSLLVITGPQRPGNDRLNPVAAG